MCCFEFKMNIIPFSIFFTGINLFNKGSGFLSERESKKERCVNKTRNIENEFTAKKLYKACMKK